MYTKLQPYASTPVVYLFSILLFLCSALSYQPACNHVDESALLSLYHGFQSTSSPLNWSASVTCCLWEGVACDLNGRVTHLQLSSRGLQGVISSSLTNLVSLRVIDFSSNHISGPIPPSIGNLLSLEELHLENNNLTGSIPPSLSKCANLTDVILRSNSLDGEISDFDWSGLAQMHKLDLAYNNFNGTLPESIYSCKSLVAYRVASNRFSGQISPKIVELKSLSYFSISDNSFTNITNWVTVLSRCQNLTMLFLSTNFQGEALPSEKSFIAPTGFPKLQLLSLGNCSLTGFFPEWLSHIKTLRFLALSRNQITGKIPDWIGTLPSLSRLLLANNNLFGEIPGQLCQLAALSANADPKLYQIESPLPNFASAPGLDTKQYTSWPTEISLRANNLSGVIPLEIGNLQGLQILYLEDNQLVGHIPASVANLTSLVALDLSQNNLSGEMPMALADLHFLAVFNVSYNDLQGRIPTGGQYESHYQGNPKLCGLLLDRPCSSHAPLPNAEALPVGSETDGRHSFLNGLFIGLASGFSSVLVMAASYFWFKIFTR